jgi:hypothetical protein
MHTLLDLHQTEHGRSPRRLLIRADDTREGLTVCLPNRDRQWMEDLGRRRSPMVIATDIPVGDTTKMTSSILINGKLKPGIYQIQNLAGQTFVETQESSRTLCCRPANALSAGDGLVSSTLTLIATMLGRFVFD